MSEEGSEVKLTNAKIVEYNNSTVEMLEIEGSKFEFADVVIDLKNIYEPLAKKIDEKGREIQKRLDKAKVEHCEKDPKNDNKPIMIAASGGGTRYKGLMRGQSEGYDEETDKLEKEARELNKAEVTIEESKFESIRKLKVEQCPKAAMKIKHWEVIRKFIDK